MALISMLVIVIAVITQGFRVPSELRGDIKGFLFVNSGFFQAVGVISFGTIVPSSHKVRNPESNVMPSICLPCVRQRPFSLALSF
jgi:hypothetical protein